KASAAPAPLPSCRGTRAQRFGSGEALKGEHPFTVLAREEGAMPRKAPVPPRIAPVQRVLAGPSTDPAEQAALDKLSKREKRKPGGQQAKMNRKDARAASNSAGKRRG